MKGRVRRGSVFVSEVTKEDLEAHWKAKATVRLPWASDELYMATFWLTFAVFFYARCVARFIL